MENKTYETMTALEFLKEAKRMCKSRDCSGCILDDDYNRDCKLSILDDSFEEFEEVVNFVYNWSKEHPVKTMADVLYEAFPEAAKRDDGIPNLCPQAVMKSYLCPAVGVKTCEQCKKEFWNKEVSQK